MKRITVILLFTMTSIFALDISFRTIPNDSVPRIALHWNENLIDTVNVTASGNYENGGIGEEIVFLDYNFDGYTDFYFFDISNLGHGVCDYYLFIYDPVSEEFQQIQTFIGDAYGLVNILQNDNGSFSQIFYFDYAGCYDTITHYTDSIVEKVHCNFDDMDLE